MKSENQIINDAKIVIRYPAGMQMLQEVQKYVFQRASDLEAYYMEIDISDPIRYSVDSENYLQLYQELVEGFIPNTKLFSVIELQAMAEAFFLLPESIEVSSFEVFFDTVILGLEKKSLLSDENIYEMVMTYLSHLRFKLSFIVPQEDIAKYNMLEPAVKIVEEAIADMRLADKEIAQIGTYGAASNYAFEHFNDDHSSLVSITRMLENTQSFCFDNEYVMLEGNIVDRVDMLQIFEVDYDLVIDVVVTNTQDTCSWKLVNKYSYERWRKSFARKYQRKPKLHKRKMHIDLYPVKQLESFVTPLMNCSYRQEMEAVWRLVKPKEKRHFIDNHIKTIRSSCLSMYRGATGQSRASFRKDIKNRVYLQFDEHVIALLLALTNGATIEQVKAYDRKILERYFIGMRSKMCPFKKRLIKRNLFRWNSNLKIRDIIDWELQWNYHCCNDEYQNYMMIGDALQRRNDNPYFAEVKMNELRDDRMKYGKGPVNNMALSVIQDEVRRGIGGVRFDPAVL